MASKSKAVSKRSGSKLDINSAELCEKIDQFMKAAEYFLKEGQEVIDKDGYVYTVSKLFIRKVAEWSKELEKQIKVDQLYVRLTYGENNEHKKEKSIKEMRDYDYVVLQKTFEELEREVIDSLEKEETADEIIPGQSSDTALLDRGSKEALMLLRNVAEQKHAMAEAKMRVLQRVLDHKLSELREIAETYGKQLAQITGVIYTIELYLGIREQVYLLNDGVRAAVEEPIHFRQELLYMDEEMGDPTDEGMDFKRIEDFDQWLVKNDNYKKLIPEQKGLITMRVRRNKKEYSDNPFVNFMMNKENFKTYILIRNGERLCRIWGDIETNQRLFPRKTEFAELLGIIDGTVTQNEQGWSLSDSDKKTAEIVITHFKRQMIMLQGLIDRTDLFHPLPVEEIRLNDPSAHEKGYVKYIYDDEIKLPSNRLPFDKWKRQLNSRITVGSRVIISGDYSDNGRYVSSKDYVNRFPMKWKAAQSHKSYIDMPPLPDAGIYVVEEFKREEFDVRLDPVEITWQQWNSQGKDKKYQPCNEDDVEEKKPVFWAYLLDERGYRKKGDQIGKYLVIRYNPGDDVAQGWKSWETDTRKNRLSFIIEPSDDFVMNFDDATYDDVDFYLNSRLDRKSYLRMMRMLHSIKEHRAKEREFEKDFVLLTVGQLLVAAKTFAVSEDKLTELVWAGVDWWKLKNKWKRAIHKDDAKALRMIQKHIENQMKFGGKKPQ